MWRMVLQILVTFLQMFRRLQDAGLKEEGRKDVAREQDVVIARHRAARESATPDGVSEDDPDFFRKP